MLEYSFKFTKFSKYASSLVFDRRDEMNHFVMGLSDDMQEECHLAMLHYNINISRLIVHAQQVEEEMSKRTSRDAKSARSFDGDSSKVRLDIKEKYRFKKRYLNKFLQSSLRLVMIRCLTL